MPWIYFTIHHGLARVIDHDEYRYYPPELWEVISQDGVDKILKEEWKEWATNGRWLDHRGSAEVVETLPLKEITHKISHYEKQVQRSVQMLELLTEMKAMVDVTT